MQRENIFANYPIGISYNVDSEHAGKVKFSITDHGTGLDREGIESLSKVSVSYEGRSIWKKEILNMPVWLRPTGGFGIGMQSLFSVANSVTMLTKTDFLSATKKIDVSPMSNGGYINVTTHTGDNMQRGTTVILDAIIDEVTHSWGSNTEKIAQYADVFQSDRFSQILDTSINETIESDKRESFFPITINGIFIDRENNNEKMTPLIQNKEYKQLIYSVYELSYHNGTKYMVINYWVC